MNNQKIINELMYIVNELDDFISSSILTGRIDSETACILVHFSDSIFKIKEKLKEKEQKRK